MKIELVITRPITDQQQKAIKSKLDEIQEIVEGKINIENNSIFQQIKMQNIILENVLNGLLRNERSSGKYIVFEKWELESLKSQIFAFQHLFNNYFIPIIEKKIYKIKKE